MWLCGSRLDGDGVQRLGDQFPVRHIGAVDGHGQWHASAIDQRRTFDAQLAAIGRVFPRFFPHPAVTWSSLRPDFATSNRSLSVRRTQPKQVPRALGIRPTPPILGNRHGSRCRSQTRAASPSIDIPWPAHTRFRLRSSSSAIAGDRPGEGRLDAVCRRN